MFKYGPLVLIFMLSLLGCGAGSASESSAIGGTTATGGTGGATGAQGGTTGSGGAGGAEPCVEPTPAEWAGPFQPYTDVKKASGTITVLPDESGGLAGVAPRIGPFVCAHDFVQVGVSYRTTPLFGYTFNLPTAVKLAFVFGDVDGNPASAPVFAEVACYTDGTEPACGPIAIEGAYPMTYVEITPIHVQPGDTLYPTVQVDNEVAVDVSEPLETGDNPGWYYAPPGSFAGGPNGLWAALDYPPPEVQAYPYPPVIRLYE